MNKRIVFSALSIFASAAFVVGATYAFFSDSETSQGNVLAAGEIDLLVGNSAWYNGQAQTGPLSWDLKNLTGDDLFFNYSDLKPGDWEEETISLRVNDNPSWVCANLKVTSDDDMDCTEPELADDATCVLENADAWDGEMGQELSFIFWADDGDNVLEGGEQVVMSGTPADLPRGDNNVGQTFPVSDSRTTIFGATPSPLPGGQTVHIGKAFCFGELTEQAVTAGNSNSPATNPGFTCDGTLVTDSAQTDKLMGDMSFMAVQARNNENFVCGEITFLELENKDASWNVISDDRYGSLSYKTAHPTFDYDLIVRGMEASTGYSLIYYPDPWPGSGSIQIAAFTTDGDGKANVSNDVDLGIDLPIASDANGAGAKFWVVRTSDWNSGQMTSWNPSEYLFEENLVTYEDTSS